MSLGRLGGNPQGNPRGSRPYVLGSAGRNPARNPSRPAGCNLGAAPVDAKGTAQDYLAHLSRIPVQIMAAKRLFPAVVKALMPPACGWSRASIRRPAARRCRLNANPAVDEGDQGARKGLF